MATKEWRWFLNSEVPRVKASRDVKKIDGYENTTNDLVTISILNVRGINSSSKQSAILELLNDHHINILGISEAILNPGNVEYTLNNNSKYSVFWVTTENDRNSGTGIMVKKLWDNTSQTNLLMGAHSDHNSKI